ncbi:MAG: transcription termination/antitermination protein NusG [Limnochordales bacterium]
MVNESRLGDAMEAAAAEETVAEDAAAEETAAETVPNEEESSPDVPGKRWYVIHTYSGYENKVKANLERRVESMDMQDKIFRIMVPTEEEIDWKDGKKRIVKKKIFPGYVLVEMIISDDSWYVVRNTPGVTGFVGAGNKPVPLDESEVKGILRQMGVDDPKPRVALEPGSEVRVVSGPFSGFTGVVEEVNLERGRVRVSVSMFGRETPVEFEFSQVEKID